MKIPKITHLFRSCSTICSAAILGLGLSSIAVADPIQHVRTESFVDWTSAGISGVGGGSGTISVAGVAGTVQLALLYWHGIDNGGGTYDNATVSINGNSITGVAIGTATTNCWDSGDSVAYRADVTASVPGDGDYTITGMSNGTNHNANGASIVVIYDDVDNTNDRDLAFFEGNDSNIPDGFPGEDNGWHASLSPINYAGGPVYMEFHMADGQSFTDGSLTLATANGTLIIPDAVGRWDGTSVPSAGTSRADNGELWDIHYFDITSAFGGVPGSVTLDLDGMESTIDCLGLVLGLVDLEAGTAPPPRQDINLTPEEATNCTTDPHMVTATLLDDDNLPVIDVNVDFEILNGPNVGLTFVGSTDGNGEISWTYNSNGTAGTDDIEACFTDNEQVEQCDLAHKTWEVCNEPPDCSQAVSSIPNDCLWPPNHKHHNVSILGITDPDGDPISIIIDAVTSDEATATELGAGGMTHAPDAIIAGDGTVYLRAERSGNGDGRVYQISGTADDGNMGQCTFEIEVQVPHHLERSICNAIDSRYPEFDATQ